MSMIFKAFLIFIGTIFLALGTIGIVLPILPTTPFLIVTLICYTHSSERFMMWFKSTKLYTKHLEPVINRKGMTIKKKFFVLALITLLISIPITIVDQLTIRIILVAIILMHYIYFIFFVKNLAPVEINKDFIDSEHEANLD